MNCLSLNAIATDISDKALDVAKNNSLKHHTEITFYQGDMIEPLIHHKVKADVFSLIRLILKKVNYLMRQLKTMNRIWLYLVEKMDCIFIIKSFNQFHQF